jgi:hypothetical protein
MKNLKEPIRSFLTCASLLACALPGLASAGTTIYDNGPPDHQSGNNMGNAWQADDFTIGTGQSPTSLTFWSLEDIGAWRGSISWSILSAPGGASLGSGTSTNVTRTSTGSFPGLSEYRNELDFGNLGLAPGTYWLVLHNGSFNNLGDPNEFLWETAAGNGSQLGMESYDGGLTWTGNFNQHAFVLSAVPEPASVAMLATGLLLAACLRRREQASAPFAR